MHNHDQKLSRKYAKFPHLFFLCLGAPQPRAVCATLEAAQEYGRRYFNTCPTAASRMYIYEMSVSETGLPGTYTNVEQVWDFDYPGKWVKREDA